MGSFDFPKIIAAAAASTLGVLSLIILAVAVLAYSFFQKSGDRVKLVVFAAMFVGAAVFGAAVLLQSHASTATPSAAANTTLPPASANTTTPVDDKAPPQQAASVEPKPTGQPAHATYQTPPQDADKPQAEVQSQAQDISGTWRDTDGFTYRFKVDGAHISYEQLTGGRHAGSGAGTQNGRNLRYAYVDDQNNGRGNCTGQVASDGTSISGKCSDGSNSWDFEIHR